MTDVLKPDEGPWEARGGGPSYIAGMDGDVPHYVVKVDHDEAGRRRTRFIATCNGSNLENEANARLIAAAPDLLASLKVLIEGVDEHWMLETPGAVDAAEAAIAKAEGQ